jgi:hypothetical protein
MTVASGENRLNKGGIEMNNISKMNVDVFWALIENAKTKGGDDYYKRESVLVEELVKYAPTDIIEFYKINRAYLDSANNDRVYAAATELSERDTPKNAGFSDDGFTDFRSWLIGQGKEVYMATIENPHSLLSFDLKPRKSKCGYIGFCWEVYFASDAYEKATGRDIYKDMAK